MRLMINWDYLFNHDGLEGLVIIGVVIGALLGSAIVGLIATISLLKHPNPKHRRARAVLSALLLGIFAAVVMLLFAMAVALRIYV
jgi:hypothetical protein